MSALASGVLACGMIAPLDGLTGGRGDAGSPDRGDGDVAAMPDGAGSGGDAGGLGASMDDASEIDTSAPPAADTGADAITGDPGDGGACVPTPLACDGTVHACDGVVDEGCPSAISIGGPGSLQLLGGDTTAGSPFDDACPANQVLVGIGGATGQWIDAVYGICGAVALDTVTSADPYAYSVSIAAGQTLPTRGMIGASDTKWQATCPPGQAVVGVAGHSGVAMDQITLSCAPILITGSPGSFVLHQGSVTALAPEGDTSGGSPFTPVVCPDPQVIGVVDGRDGQWVDSMSVACVTPSLALVH